MTMDISPSDDIKGAYCLLNLGDSITTDHISPAGVIAVNSPAARFLKKEEFKKQTLIHMEPEEETMKLWLEEHLLM